MSKNIRTVYLYIVSFITLCMMVGAFVGIVNTTVSYLYPNVNYYGAIYPVTMSEKYVSSDTSVGSATVIAPDKYDEATAVENYKKELAKEEEAQKIRSLKSLFSAIAFLVVSTPLFIYHWVKIEKERKEEGVV